MAGNFNIFLFCGIKFWHFVILSSSLALPPLLFGIISFIIVDNLLSVGLGLTCVHHLTWFLHTVSFGMFEVFVSNWNVIASWIWL